MPNPNEPEVTVPPGLDESSLLPMPRRDDATVPFYGGPFDHDAIERGRVVRYGPTEDTSTPARCDNCRFSDRRAAPEAVGVVALDDPPAPGPLACRRYPPNLVVIPEIRGAQIVTLDLQVDDDAWCGEYQPRPFETHPEPLPDVV